MHGIRVSAVNYHLIKACNDRCSFCFATFRDVRRHLPLPEVREVVRLLAEAGAEKINFAGGEPTLHPHLPELIRYASGLGVTTSIVTNGARLPFVLDRVAGALDWVALSVDSADEQTQQALGRGRGHHASRSLALAERALAAGCRLKLNTVVTRLNHQEDLSDYVRRMAPERWKIFQVLPVEGQNDGSVEPLLISSAEFKAFVKRHQALSQEGIELVPEDNDAMTDSYAMVDPMGRFYGNGQGRLHVSRPIHEVGVQAALHDVGFEHRRLEARGGLYEWRSPESLPASA